MKKDPIQFMVKHKDTIYESYRLGGGVTQSWRLLEDWLPEIHEEMKISTFATYMSIFGRFLDEMNRKSKVPRNIYGWTVHYSDNDGYYRLYKKRKGQAHTLYIGKVFDEESAKEKIIEREIEMRVGVVDKKVKHLGDSKFSLRLSFDGGDPPTNRAIKQAFNDLLSDLRGE